MSLTLHVANEDAHRECNSANSVVGGVLIWQEPLDHRGNLEPQLAHAIPDHGIMAGSKVLD